MMAPMLHSLLRTRLHWFFYHEDKKHYKNEDENHLHRENKEDDFLQKEESVHGDCAITYQ